MPRRKKHRRGNGKEPETKKTTTGRGQKKSLWKNRKKKNTKWKRVHSKRADCWIPIKKTAINQRRIERPKRKDQTNCTRVRGRLYE